MPIPVECSSCRATMQAPDTMAGQQAKCSCGAVVTVPSAGGQASPAGIPVACSACDQKFMAPPSMAGQQAKCSCGAIVSVPQSGKSGKPASASKSSGKSKPAKTTAGAKSSSGAAKIVVTCSACGKQAKAPAAMAGKKAKCSCGAVIAVPASQGQAKSKPGAAATTPSASQPAQPPATQASARGIPITCLSCGQSFSAPESMAGQSAKCPCGQVIQVPAPGRVAGLGPLASPAPAGADPLASDPLGAGLSAEPLGADPLGADPLGADPLGTPLGADPLAADPFGAPLGADPLAADPFGAPLGADPLAADPLGAADPLAAAGPLGAPGAAAPLASRPAATTRGPAAAVPWVALGFGIAAALFIVISTFLPWTTFTQSQVAGDGDSYKFNLSAFGKLSIAEVDSLELETSDTKPPGVFALVLSGIAVLAGIALGVGMQTNGLPEPARISLMMALIVTGLGSVLVALSWIIKTVMFSRSMFDALTDTVGNLQLSTSPGIGVFLAVGAALVATVCFSQVAKPAISGLHIRLAELGSLVVVGGLVALMVQPWTADKEVKELAVVLTGMSNNEIEGLQDDRAQNKFPPMISALRSKWGGRKVTAATIEEFKAEAQPIVSELQEEIRRQRARPTTRKIEDNIVQLEDYLKEMNDAIAQAESDIQGNE